MRIHLLKELRARPWFYLLFTAVFVLAYSRVFGDHRPRVPVLFNVSDSLPYKVALVDYSKRTYVRGDYIVYAFKGGAVKPYPGLRDQPFFKQVRGMPGDQITVQGRRVFVNGELVGIAKPFGPRRVALNPISPGVIPPGYFFVQGTGIDSFDSRYALSGLVSQQQILAAVKPLY